MKTHLPTLPAALEKHGYFETYAHLGDGNMRLWDWGNVAKILKGDALTLWNFFLVGKPASRERIAKLAGSKTLDELTSSGIVSTAKGKAVMKRHALISFHGMPLFVNRALTSSAYFGEETRALLSLLPFQARGRSLCFNTGTGAEAIVLANHGAEDLVIQGTKEHERLIQTNLLLNQLPFTPRFVSGHEDLKGAGKLDAAFAQAVGFVETEGNPLPEGLGGGVNGMALLERVLDLAASDRPSVDRVSLVTICYGEYDRDGALGGLSERLRARGLAADLHVISKFRMEPGVPILNQTLGLTAAATGKAVGPLVDRLMGQLEREKISGAFLLKGRVWKAKKPSIKICNFSDAYYGGWSF